ncbi:hypothetical protein Tco_0774568 [Tanacetum coccineum]|uniref:CCHC-type domain-containing protein n=1 Tax=Tanacetum coccineum TaxID=301880 RepID=A0ABQ4ZSL9_9ASTR
MSSYNHFGCSWCGGPFNGGNCPSCSIVGAENEFVHDPNPFPYDNTPDFYDQPPQPQYESYLCELCGNDSHFGYDCPPRFPLVYEQEPSYNQNYSDNYYPQNSPSFPQQYLCCESCGGPHESFQCQPMNQNYFKPNPIYNSSYFGFDQPPQYSINHQEDLNQQRISDVHNGWDKMDELQNELFQMIQSFCEKFLQQKHAASIDQSPLQEISLQEIEDLKQHYLDEMLSLSNDLGIKDYRIEKIDIRFRRECENMIDELKGKFNGISIEINKKKELQQLEQAAKLSTYTTKPSRRFNYFYDDDDEESSIPLREIISELPPSIAITPVSSTIEPEDSFIMGNEELSTIPKKESDEFIKSSVEDLVPIPSESEDTSKSDSDCDLPSCDNISPINVSEEKFVTFLIPLFYSNDNFTYSDDEPLSDEDDIECKDSYDSNLDESTFLVTPLFDSNEDECFTPSDDVELLLHRDSSTPMISVVSILEGFTDEPPLEENDDLFDLESKGNEWKKILYDAPIDDLMTEDKDCLDFEGSRARGFVHRSLDLQSFTCLYMGIRYPRSY